MASSDVGAVRLRELLGRLEEHLVAQGAVIARHWADGLAADEAVARVEAATGLRLPVEAQVWFGWHNGVVDGVSLRWRYEAEILPGWTLLSLEEAVDHYQARMEVQRGFEDGLIWADDWFPLLRQAGGHTIAVSCAVAEGEPAPVHAVYIDDFDHIPAAASLADAVAYWVGLFDDGSWRFDPSVPDWVYIPINDPRVTNRRLFL